MIEWVEPAEDPTTWAENRIALLRAAVIRRPDGVALHRSLAAALDQAHDPSDAATAWRQVIRLDPDRPNDWIALGAALHRAARPAEAAEAFAQAVRLAPAHGRAHAALSGALARIGERDKADEAARRGWALDPNDPAIRKAFGDYLIRQGDGAGLLALSRERAERADCPAWVLAHLTIALALLDRREALAPLIDYDNLIRITAPPPPAGFATIKAFNDQLAAELGAIPARPIGGGWNPQSPVRDGIVRDGGAVTAMRGAGTAAAALVAGFKRAVAEYADATAGLIDPRLARRRPARARIESTSHVTGGASHIAPHCHPYNWLNAVYYVRLPPDIAEAPDHGGWLEFSLPRHKLPDADRIAPPRLIAPAEGHLAIFPAYLYHQTMPSRDTSPRIAITFDVHPVDS